MVRYKHRYLLCELVSEDARCRLSLDDRVLGGLVRDTIARVHGTFGAAACSVGFAVRYVNAYTGVVLLRCRKEFYRLLWSALPFITHLESKGHRYSCFLNTLHVGGKSGGSLCAVAVFLSNSSELSGDSCRVSCVLQDVLPSAPAPERQRLFHKLLSTKTLHVPGTIRTCQKFLIRYNRRQLLPLLQNCTDEGEQEAIKKSFSISRLLEKEPSEELSDIAGEDTAEAIE